MADKPAASTNLDMFTMVVLRRRIEAIIREIVRLGDHYGVEVKGAVRSVRTRRKPFSVNSTSAVTVSW